MEKNNNITLKYSSADVLKMIDIFCNLSSGIDDEILLRKEIEKLTQYPPLVVEEFLKCVDLIIENKTDLMEKYRGVIGYITMRINLVEMYNL